MGLQAAQHPSILVTNPLDNTPVDVMPLFNLVKEFEGSNGTLANVTDRIDDIIRNFNLLVHAEPDEGWERIRSDMNFSLFLLRDAFKAMAENRSNN